MKINSNPPILYYGFKAYFVNGGGGGGWGANTCNKHMAPLTDEH